MQPAALVLHLFLLSFNMGAPAPAAPALPANVWVQAELHPVVGRLLQGSPTFRTQIQRIGAQPNFRVHVFVDPNLHKNRFCRAQCVMRSYTSGLVIAAITVPNNDTHNLELIPHEFEHVLERVEGVDLRRALAGGKSGVYASGEGRIETDRARHAGRKARLEMQTVTLLTTRGPAPNR